MEVLMPLLGSFSIKNVQLIFHKKTFVQFRRLQKLIACTLVLDKVASRSIHKKQESENLRR